MAGIIWALVSSLSYGISDFLAGFASRKRSVVSVTGFVYLAGMIGIAAATPFVPAVFSTQALWTGLAAGFFAVFGLLCFYAALAIGPISIISPLIAMLQAFPPLIVAVVRGDDIGALAWVGIGFALVATLLVTIEGKSDKTSDTDLKDLDGSAQAESSPKKVPKLGLVLALFSAFGGLGISVVFLDYAPDDAGLLPVLFEIIIGMAIMTCLMFARKYSKKFRSKISVIESHDNSVASAVAWRSKVVLLSVIFGGLLMGLANISLLLGLQNGEMAPVAVVMGLYPVFTVLLATTLLKERLNIRQIFGISLAIIACVLLGFSA